MTALELARLVQDMRLAQRRYFAGRSPQALSDSKKLEHQVDRAVREILGNEPAPLLAMEGS